MDINAISFDPIIANYIKHNGTSFSDLKDNYYWSPAIYRDAGIPHTFVEIRLSDLPEEAHNEYIEAVNNDKKPWEELSYRTQEKYRDKARELTQDTLYCTRVWEAWSYGTMTENDFTDTHEDDDFIEDIAEAIYKGL